MLAAPFKAFSPPPIIILGWLLGYFFIFAPLLREEGGVGFRGEGEFL